MNQEERDAIEQSFKDTYAKDCSRIIHMGMDSAATIKVYELRFAQFCVERDIPLTSRQKQIIDACLSYVCVNAEAWE